MCLWCPGGGRMFPTTKAAQQHMVDKGHCKLQIDDGTIEYADYYDYRSSYPDYDASKTDEADEEEVDQSSGLPEINYQLVLPSGNTIGHRSLQRYFKENLKGCRFERRPGVLNRLLSQYKALGWSGATRPEVQQRARDQRFVQRLRHKQHMQSGVKNNKL